MKALVARLIGLPPGEDPVFAVECDDMGLLRRLALATDTVIAASDAGLGEDVAAGAFVQLVVEDLPEVYSEMGVVTLTNRTPSPMAQRAIACVRDIAKGVNLPIEP
jgi:DNA-binding transcriptional LysR family regulator